MQIACTLGPIIGKVTHDSARILLECDCDVALKCVVTDPEGEALTVEQKRLEANRPAVFATEGTLKEGVRYTVSFFIDQLEGEPETKEADQTLATIPASFTTLLQDAAPRLGFVSCNKLRVTRKLKPELDLWRCMAKKIENDTLEFDMLCHLGDQVYVDHHYDYGSKDSVHGNILELLRDVEPDQREEFRGRVVHMIRTRYRETWTHPPTATVLANVPSIMIFDDHEIRDDWGDKKDDYTEGTLDHFIGSCAKQVILEYQQQLHADVDMDAELHRFYHAHAFGQQTRLVLLDVRGCKTFSREDDTYLGKTQEAWLLEDQLQDMDVKHLVLASPIPFSCLPARLNETMMRVSNDVLGCWSYKDYANDLQRILDALVVWKSKRQERKLTLVGGDVHWGSHALIKHKQKVVGKQLVTSPVANHGPTIAEHSVLNALKTLPQKFGEVSFVQKDWIRFRNYGVVDANGEKLVYVTDDGALNTCEYSMPAPRACCTVQ